MNVAIILACILFGYILGRWAAMKVICWCKGHDYDESQVLWRDCKRCGKHQTLKIGYGYVD